MVDVVGAQAAGDAPEQIELLERARAARQHAELRPARAQPFDNLVERTFPVGLDPFLAVAQQRALQAIGAVHALVAEAVAVGDPGLVDRFVLTRHDTHQLAAQHVAEQIRADSVVRRDERLRSHFPGARAEAVRLGDERTDGAQVDDVARELVVHGAFEVRAHFHLLAAADHPELLYAGDLFRETNAARAMDAAGHVGRDEGTQVLVRHDTLALGEA